MLYARVTLEREGIEEFFESTAQQKREINWNLRGYTSFTNKELKLFRIALRTVKFRKGNDYSAMECIFVYIDVFASLRVLTRGHTDNLTKILLKLKALNWMTTKKSRHVVMYLGSIVNK